MTAAPVACWVKRYATEHGWVGSCSCGWRCCRVDRAARDADVQQHLHPTTDRKDTT